MKIEIRTKGVGGENASRYKITHFSLLAIRKRKNNRDEEFFFQEKRMGIL